MSVEQYVFHMERARKAMEDPEVLEAVHELVAELLLSPRGGMAELGYLDGVLDLWKRRVES